MKSIHNKAARGEKPMACRTPGCTTVNLRSHCSDYASSTCDLYACPTCKGFGNTKRWAVRVAS